MPKSLFSSFRIRSIYLGYALYDRKMTVVFAIDCSDLAKIVSTSTELLAFATRGGIHEE